MTMENLNQDSPLHLADTLADEIAHTPAQTLLGEVAEDLGDRHALASEFDAVVARALHQSRRKALTAAMKNLAAWLSQGLLRKPVLIRVGTLAVLLVAVGGYYYHDARRVGVPIASLNPPPPAPRQPGMGPPFSAYTNDDRGGSQAPAAAGMPAAAAPPPSPQVQSDLQKAESAYGMARAYEARARATDAFDRGDYPTAIASLTEALRSCANRCEPEVRAALDFDLERAQAARNTNTAVAVAAAPQPAANGAQAVAAAKSPPLPSLAWPAQGRIAVNFGARTVAVADAQARTSEGITIAVPETADVRAAADGIVSYVGSDKGPGKFVLIRHDGDLNTGYGHLRSVKVKASDQVHRGEVIAKGLASRAGAPSQLYFEVRQGAAAVDPMQYLPQDQDTKNTRKDRR
jgi:murein DD-endopeptidase MepM/ murein hydrolase activator NlpD